MSRIAKDVREWDVFVKHAKEVYGVEKEALHRVEVKLDVAKELRKMRLAYAKKIERRTS